MWVKPVTKPTQALKVNVGDLISVVDSVGSDSVRKWKWMWIDAIAYVGHSHPRTFLYTQTLNPFHFIFNPVCMIHNLFATIWWAAGLSFCDIGSGWMECWSLSWSEDLQLWLVWFWTEGVCGFWWFSCFLLFIRFRENSEGFSSPLASSLVVEFVDPTIFFTSYWRDKWEPFLVREELQWDIWSLGCSISVGGSFWTQRNAKFRLKTSWSRGKILLVGNGDQRSYSLDLEIVGICSLSSMSRTMHHFLLSSLTLLFICTSSFPAFLFIILQLSPPCLIFRQVP